MAGDQEEANDPRAFRLTWHADTPLLTTTTARAAALGIGFLFALIFGAVFASQPAAPSAALAAAAAGAGATVLLLAGVVFGLFSNTVRKRFTATDRGLTSTIVSPRIARHIPGAARHGDVHAWDLVARVRLDAEYGRVLIKLRTSGWRAIHCPDGGFVATAREIRRLIDNARGLATAPTEALTAVPPARSARGHLSGTAA